MVSIMITWDMVFIVIKKIKFIMEYDRTDINCIFNIMEIENEAFP